MDAIVRLKNVYMSYFEGSERVILKEAQAAFPRAQSTALLGPSGTGKSTVLNLIAGLDLPQQGEIWFKEESLSQMSERKRSLFRRQHMGIVFQFFNLLPHLNVLENIALPLHLLGEPKALERAQEWLHKVGLAGRESSFPDKLSGGEQQRVALARALIHRPSLVLADEPTGNLDPQTGEKIVSLLFEWVAQGQQSLIFVTHNAELAARADCIYDLRGGQLCLRN